MLCAAALACLALTTVACGGSSSGGGSTAARSGGAKPTLTIAENLACGPMDVGMGGGGAGQMDLGLAYEALIRYKPDGSLAPGLATSWKLEPGNEVIVFTLRQNARFSDGTPVTGQAVKTWLDLRNSITSPLDQLIGRIKSVAVPSRYVVSVTLANPNPDAAKGFSQYLQSNWGFVTSPKAIARVKGDPKRAYFGSHTDGAGQYVLDPAQSVQGDHCTWVPNKYYYDPSQIKWGKVVTRSIPDANSLLAAMQTGQVDVGVGESSTVAAAKAAGLNVVYSPGRLQGIYFYDHSGRLNPALADVRVRQALNYAVDRRTITESLFGSDAQPTSNPNPTSDGDDPSTFNYYSYDPAKARSLLAAAGYANGLTLKVDAPGAWIGAYKTLPLAQAVAADLAKVGVRMEITQSTSLGEWLKAIGSRTFDAGSAIFGTNTTWAFYPLAMHAGGLLADQHGWTDPVSERMWETGSKQDPQAAKATWKALMNRMITQAYELPVLAPGFYTYVSKRVAGVEHINDGAWGPLDGWTPAQ